MFIPLIKPASHEFYRYSREGYRVLKVSEQLTDTRQQLQWVRYLPGLENRLTRRENCQVVTLAGVRIQQQLKGKRDDVTDPKIHYHTADHLGSSQLDLDKQGKIISLERYYSFGGTAYWATRQPGDSEDKTLRYGAKERDITGLYYYGFRYYAPWLGRWLNADPAATVDGLNVFSFTLNNPVSHRDADGRMVDDEPSTSAASVDSELQKIARLADYPYSRQRHKTGTWHDRCIDLELTLIEQLQQNWPNIKSVKLNGEPDGIKNKSSGLYAYVFKTRKKDNDYAISFGGTTAGDSASSSVLMRGVLNVVSNIAQIGADIKNWRGGIPESYQQADELVKALYQHIPQGSQLTLTGHSLGAALAEYSGGCNYQEGMNIVGFSPAMLGENAYDAIRDSRHYDLQPLQAHTRLYTIEGDKIPYIKAKGGGHLVELMPIPQDRRISTSFIPNIAAHNEVLRQISDTTSAERVQHQRLRRLYPAANNPQ